MKKIIILPFLFLSFLSWGQAQFVVQNGAKTEVYKNINDAITNAVAGDTLYIPGGGFTINPATITKTLHWVGHGHYPDSTTATMQSRIISDLNFNGTCSGSSFEGIYFTGEMHFGYDNLDVSNITIKRCRIGNTLFLRRINVGNPDLNFQIIECVTQAIVANNGSNCLVKKSMVFGVMNNFFDSFFIHNDICGNSSQLIYYCNNCQFTDNVFSSNAGTSGTINSTFDRNIFAGGVTYGTNSGNDNMYNVGSANIYTDISHSPNINTFSYDNDYSLNSSSTGTLETDGSTVNITGTALDGTNAGIYGTTTPFKIIPYYPHINTAIIDNEATNNQLGVEINVKAQTR